MGKAAGAIALSDTLREKAAPMIGKLRSMNVESVLLTGDNKSAAQAIADKVKVSDVRSELLPGDKQKIIQEYQKQGHKVCMIGDGVNDAVALRTADAAIAMGGIGSDIAIESSDVVLVQDDIGRVPYLIYLSRKVLGKIQSNIIISLSINALATVLAATGVLNAIIGALVHNAGSVFVVLNSLFLLSVKDPEQRYQSIKMNSAFVITVCLSAFFGRIAYRKQGERLNGIRKIQYPADPVHALFERSNAKPYTAQTEFICTQPHIFLSYG
jgi:cation transport ATPase